MNPKHPNPDDSQSAEAPALPDGPEGAALWLARAIDWAHRRGATDLHFFPAQDSGKVWVRIDGDLNEICAYSPEIHRRVVARLKVMARCADYDGELVQEGRFSLNGSSASGEARLSVIPTLQGEKAVVRLTGGEVRARGLSELGFDEPLIEALRSAMDAPQGLLLAVGPSGCGKSTALYALLRDLNERHARPISMVSIEDPVEQTLPGVAQMSIDPSRGLGFAQGLRAVLRQDPEVIMIGEIRDVETAETALQAALTGHRLLSSMHTISAAEALVRLRQMGAAPYVLTSALGGILNLRLVRLLCPECREEVSDARQEAIGLLVDMLKGRATARALGCEVCLNSGHRGRTALAEWLRTTPMTTQALRRDDDTQTLASTLIVEVGARDCGARLAFDRSVSIEELAATVGLHSLAAGATS